MKRKPCIDPARLRASLSRFVPTSCTELTAYDVRNVRNYIITSPDMSDLHS